MRSASVALLLPALLWTTHALVIVVPPPRHIRRRGTEPRAQLAPDLNPEPPASETDLTEIDRDDYEFEDSERVLVPYPDDLHEAGKADRKGPFWSTLGEPDENTGSRPNYLRRDDWHVSSTYTTAERAAAVDKEEEWLTSASIEVPAEIVDEELDPFRERDSMKCEDTISTGAEPSKLTMPQTWQQYQFMQEQLAGFATDERLSANEREESAQHEHALAEFYGEFKVIVAEGWELLNNLQVEAAASFLIATRKAHKVTSVVSETSEQQRPI